MPIEDEGTVTRPSLELESTKSSNVFEPRKAFVALAVAGAIRGRVLEIGCGSGENSLYLAKRGSEVWGIDMVRTAVKHAQNRANEYGLDANFVFASALELEKLGQTFDTVIDSGMFQVFGERDRQRFAAGLKEVLNIGGRFHVLCFAEQDAKSAEPCNIRMREIQACFTEGWRILKMEPSLYEDPEHDCTQAWLATIERLPDDDGTIS